ARTRRREPRPPQSPAARRLRARDERRPLWLTAFCCCGREIVGGGDFRRVVQPCAERATRVCRDGQRARELRGEQGTLSQRLPTYREEEKTHRSPGGQEARRSGENLSKTILENLLIS